MIPQPASFGYGKTMPSRILCQLIILYNKKRRMSIAEKGLRRPEFSEKTSYVVGGQFGVECEIDSEGDKL